MRRALSALCAAAALAAASPASAGCGWSGSTGMVFGAYDPLALLPLSGAGTLTYTCTTPLTPVTIWLSTGRSATFASRTMAAGASVLTYNLYTDAAHLLVWGDGSSAHYSGVSPALGTAVAVPVFGAIPAGQNAKAGAYADTITATLNF